MWKQQPMCIVYAALTWLQVSNVCSIDVTTSVQRMQYWRDYKCATYAVLTWLQVCNICTIHVTTSVQRMQYWRDYTLSGHQARWLPRMLKLQSRFPVELRPHRFILCTRCSRGTAHKLRLSDQSIGSTVSDAIVRSWLRSTATRSSPLSYFSRLLQVVDNWPHILW